MFPAGMAQLRGGATPPPMLGKKTGVGQKIIISWSKCGYDGLIFRKNYNF